MAAKKFYPWLIVEFDSEDIEYVVVVPESWMEEYEGQNFIWYPENQSVTFCTKAIRDQIEPDKFTWSKIMVKNMCNTFMGDFLKARETENYAKNYGVDSVNKILNDSLETGRGHRRKIPRIIKWPGEVTTEYSDSSDDDNTMTEVPKKKQSPRKRVSARGVSISETAEMQVQLDELVKQALSESSLNVETMEVEVVLDPTAATEETDAENSVSSNATPVVVEEEFVLVEGEDTVCFHKCCVHKLTVEIKNLKIDMNARFDDVCNQVSLMNQNYAEKLKAGNVPIPATNVRSSGYIKLPMETLEDFTCCEDKLKTSEEASIFLKSHMVINSKGKELSSVVNKMLSSTLTNELAMNMLWVGRNNNKFCLKETTYARILAEAIQMKDGHERATMPDIKECAMQWLRQAKTSEQGKQHRREVAKAKKAQKENEEGEAE